MHDNYSLHYWGDTILFLIFTINRSNIKEDLHIEEHIKAKNFALNSSSRNFTGVIMFANKDIPENLVVERQLSEIHLYI